MQTTDKYRGCIAGIPGYFNLTEAQWKALADGAAAMQHQNQKFPDNSHQPEHWLVILGEECGEVSREVFNLRIRPGSGGCSLAETRQNYRTELAQVAAVALAALADDTERKGR